MRRMWIYERRNRGVCMPKMVKAKEKILIYWELDKEKYKELMKLKKQGKIKGDICPISYLKRKIIKSK